MVPWVAAGAASVAALLASYVALRVWVRSTPAHVLAECRSAQESAAKAEQLARAANAEAERLRGAWHTTTQDLEKYLDSIDSRARRLSAARSAEERGERRGNQGGDGSLDVEALTAALRNEAGI